MRPSQQRRRKIAGRIALTLAGLYLLLLTPVSNTPEPAASDKQPFVWNKDEYWQTLEERFKNARQQGCEELAPVIEAEFTRGIRLLDALAASPRPSVDALFDEIEKSVFEAAPQVAACPQHLPDYIQLQSRLRKLVKAQSQQWNFADAATRNRIYRLLYGSRAALEEVMLQAPHDSLPALARGQEEPSQTPPAKILGVTIHSGDILVSRGGAPTSALIARGNDYPGNFSHVALVHVDEKTSLASIIESHIERGVAIATLEDYLRDKKLRVMVMRLRADLPPLASDPLLPHKAATAALQQARTQHVPYDFEMNYHDDSKQFCSEVVSVAYRKFGVNLWMGISHISTPGVSAWLAAFGVKHFETQEPADLEYDPQLRVVAEWRDPETLYLDHVDNAVIDAMLEGAEAGDRLGYTWYLLPLARVMKGYSMLLNAFGKVGPVPEGMNAAAALRHQQFNQAHRALKEKVLQQAEAFQQQNGYRAPYWELVRLAREARKAKM